ncbi:Ig-like domain-containing protein [Niallia circulans]|uniref:Ig-like domain-containing protein n=1 Tax=Niallia circulans TaxID=1397 RepID=UPI00352403FE
MKKKLFLLIATITVIISSLSFYQFNSNKVEAANIGQQLTEPEKGWTRYDDSNENIKYEGTGWTTPTPVDKAPYNYGKSHHQTNIKGDKITVKFKGTKLRIIARANNIDRASKVKITIDGVTEYYTEQAESQVLQSLVYEKTELKNDIHEVVIEAISNEFITLDAIEIGDQESLLNANNVMVDSIQLSKETLNIEIGSSESLVVTIEPENATNKTIKWTSSNPEIATVDDNGNVIGKSPGKVTITAETTDGSNLKATTEVTVKEAELEGNKGILKLTTTTGDLHEYDLSRTEINNFIAWLDKKGEGKPYYEFKLNVTTGNIKSRTEYIMFDEIVSFVIDEY